MSKPRDVESDREFEKRLRENGESLSAHMPVFGHVVWLCARSNVYRHWFVQELDSRVFPPMLLGQFKLYVNRAAGQMPQAFASWAFLSAAAEDRYVDTQRLAPSDWRSGDRLWLVDLVAPFGGAMRILKELYHETFGKADVRLLHPKDDGRLDRTSLSQLIRDSQP